MAKSAGGGGRAGRTGGGGGSTRSGGSNNKTASAPPIQIGQRVRVTGNVRGQGRYGTVTYSNSSGTFHGVSFRAGSGENAGASYHASDLRVAKHRPQTRRGL